LGSTVWWCFQNNFLPSIPSLNFLKFHSNSDETPPSTWQSLLILPILFVAEEVPFPSILTRATTSYHIWSNPIWRLRKDSQKRKRLEGAQYKNTEQRQKMSYQLYRNTTLGNSLQESLDELIQVKWKVFFPLFGVKIIICVTSL